MRIAATWRSPAAQAAGCGRPRRRTTCLHSAFAAL